MKILFYRILLFLIYTGTVFTLNAQQTLEIGPGKPFLTLTQAAQVAQPGDTLLLSSGIFAGGIYIENLQGLPEAWITIRGATGGMTIIQGGTNAIQMTDPAYLVIEQLRFREQTGNGVNIDDGGSYNTPAHHIHLRNCIFEDMNASGNNDLLKLSGLDSFLITACLFQNGAAGGSGIDMVGCHHGTIEKTQFHQLGSNSIQAKGGTRYINILQNSFIDGGLRSLNLGGSTGAAFFRPFGANYEAADLDVAGNLFIGSQAPIAYVGSQRVRVWNNTIYRPDKWVIRILQESSDTSFYQAVADGEFVNNLIVVDNKMAVATNIGPNTNSGSFLFARNLWYHLDQSNWSGPYLPVSEIEGMIQIDPMLTDPSQGDVHLLPTSPAIMAGWPLPNSQWLDLDGKSFLTAPSIGCFEGGQTSSFTAYSDQSKINLYPNPSNGFITLSEPFQYPVSILDASGHSICQMAPHTRFWDLTFLDDGIYFIIQQGQRIVPTPIIIHKK